MKAFLGTAGSILRARIAPTVASPLVSCTRNGSSARGEMLVSRRGRAFSRSRGAAKAQEMCAVQGQPVLVQFSMWYESTWMTPSAVTPALIAVSAVLTARIEPMDRVGQRPVRGIRQESAMDVRAAPCWNWPTDAALVRRTRAVHEHAAIAGSCWRCGNDGLLLCQASEYKRQATSSGVGPKFPKLQTEIAAGRDIAGQFWLHM